VVDEDCCSAFRLSSLPSRVPLASLSLQVGWPPAVPRFGLPGDVRAAPESVAVQVFSVPVWFWPLMGYWRLPMYLTLLADVKYESTAAWMDTRSALYARRRASLS